MSQTVDQIVAATGLPKAVVIVLFSLSYPLRYSLRGMMIAAQAYISAELGNLEGLATKGDFVATMLRGVQVAMEQAMEPIDRVLRTIPFDEIVASDPVAIQLVDAIQRNLNLQIPSTGFSNFVGLGGLDLFEGINGYQDVKRKIRELEFKTVRATAVSNYAARVQTVMAQDFIVLQQYIDVLDAI